MALGNKRQLPWWRSKYILWIFIMLPGLLFTVNILRSTMTYDDYMHATGEFSGRFLLFSLIATPLLMLLPKYKFPKWLNRNKRYFGIAAFSYALCHTILYVVEKPISELQEAFFDLGLITAWLSLMIWLPMAITSTDAWVKRLKSKWKKIHNWGYLAALLAFLHWAFIHYHWKAALLHAAPILVLQGYRWWKVFFVNNSKKES